MNNLRAIIWTAVSTKEQTNEDKFSLPLQADEGRAICTANDWRIVDVLEVPGHSRHYSDIHELAAHARKQGINAFDKILEYWEHKAFDVLICRDGNRFARRQSLHAYFVENTIDIGARIYSKGAWVDKSNYLEWTMSNGYKAASEVNWLVEARNAGMEKRMERGLNGGLGVPDPYRIVRNESGKALRLEFRPEYRRLMDDAADLLLARVGWKAFAVDLYRRDGHVNPKTGQPYHDNNFYRWFYNPYVWGITAKNYEGKYGLWVFDENEPLPDGVKVNRHPNPPIPAAWTDDKADLIKAELRRRATMVTGRAVANTKFAFTGLFVCATCGRRMAVDNKANHLYWRCSSHTYRHSQTGQACTNRRLLRNDVAEDQINDFLVQLLAQEHLDFVLLTSERDDVERARQNAESLQHEIAKLQSEIGTMIVRQSQAPSNVQDSYSRQIDQASQRLAILESNLKRAAVSVEGPAIVSARQLAYERLQTMGLPALWQLSPSEVNQLLHALMGKYCFAVTDGEIIDVRHTVVSKPTFVKAGSLTSSELTVTFTERATIPQSPPDCTTTPDNSSISSPNCSVDNSIQGGDVIAP